MVVIRLTKVGAVKQPKFRVLVADHRYWRGGKHLEIVGHYNAKPRGQEKMVELKMDRIEHWVKLGAQPSERVKKLMKIFKEGPRKA